MLPQTFSAFVDGGYPVHLRLLSPPRPLCPTAAIYSLRRLEERTVVLEFRDVMDEAQIKAGILTVSQMVWMQFDLTRQIYIMLPVAPSMGQAGAIQSPGT